VQIGVAVANRLHQMQAEAPEAFDAQRESPKTKKLYGLDDPVTISGWREALQSE
jgi:hypothetical protein